MINTSGRSCPEAKRCTSSEDHLPVRAGGTPESHRCRPPRCRLPRTAPPQCFPLEIRTSPSCRSTTSPSVTTSTAKPRGSRAWPGPPCPDGGRGPLLVDAARHWRRIAVSLSTRPHPARHRVPRHPETYQPRPRWHSVSPSSSEPLIQGKPKDPLAPGVGPRSVPVLDPRPPCRRGLPRDEVGRRLVL